MSNDISADSRILVTGAAGFIGFHLADYLLKKGFSVTGIDNLNDYYDPKLKQDRLNFLIKHEAFRFHKIDIINNDELERIFREDNPAYVVNLAAQAGVRYSIQNPHAYIESNILGFLNVLEACKNFNVKHLIYASSSSVYGGNKTQPFSTNHNVDHPVSMYAATKKSNELMAHTYSHLYALPTTGLRFFTVYGPWGRPDMAYFSFTRDILSGKPIKVFNHGDMERDFTYVDDIVEGIFKLLDKPPKACDGWNEKDSDISCSFAPYRIYNIGNNCPVKLMRMISTLEKNLGVETEKIYMDMPRGDVKSTFADIDDLAKDIGFKPQTSIEDGIKKFIDWYKNYYQVGNNKSYNKNS